MNIAKYEELTGTTVPDSDVARVTAQLARTQSMLETMLGYTLDPDLTNTNLYNELGKTQLECACPNVDTENLDPPDPVVGAYRLFNYNTLDKFIQVDPFIQINKVKLVYLRPGSGDNGVTMKTFDSDEVRIHQGRDSWSKYLERCLNCFCVCDCNNCVQLAVDAEWGWDEPEDIPDEILYVQAEMARWYSDVKKDIRSQSIDSHSYTKFDRSAPESEPYNLSVIKRYAGPNGSVMVMPV